MQASQWSRLPLLPLLILPRPIRFLARVIAGSFCRVLDQIDRPGYSGLPIPPVLIIDMKEVQEVHIHGDHQWEWGPQHVLITQGKTRVSQKDCSSTGAWKERGVMRVSRLPDG